MSVTDSLFRRSGRAVAKPIGVNLRKSHAYQASGPVGAVCNRTIGVNLRKSRHVFHRKVLLSGNTSYIM